MRAKAALDQPPMEIRFARNFRQHSFDLLNQSIERLVGTILLDGPTPVP